MTLVVGFDTATDDVAAALTRGGEILDERLLAAASDGRPRHATVLLPALESLV